MATQGSQLLCAALFLTIGATASARDLGAFDFEYCKVKEELAGQIMEARQMGRPMSSVMDTVRAGSGDPQFAVKAVQKAYDEPRFNSSANQRRAVIDFSSSYYAACLKARAENRAF